MELLFQSKQLGSNKLSRIVCVFSDLWSFNHMYLSYDATLMRLSFWWLLILTQSMQGFAARQQSKNVLMLTDNEHRLYGTARKAPGFHSAMCLLSQHLISVFISKWTPWPQQPALHQNEISNVWRSLLRTVRCDLHGLRFVDMSDFNKSAYFAGDLRLVARGSNRREQRGYRKTKK